MSGSERGRFSNDQENATMSSKAKPYIIGAALGASTMFFALQYHVVHSHDGFQIIPRTPQQSIGLAYADIRSWSPSQWTDRPELARALMAHGSTDLIADSVASTLADTVSEDSQGLDDLRAFLNETRSKVEEGADELLSIPRDDDMTDSSEAPAASESPRVGRGRSSDSRINDVVGIPYPKDAEKPAADPFRPPIADDSTEPGTMAGSNRATDVASRTETPVKGNTSPGGSRISADDILSGFDDVESSRPAKPVQSNRKGGTSSKSSSVLEQARKTESLIFGDEPTGISSGKGPASKPTAKPSEPANEPESIFEEVTSQLENRAQDALNRAQEQVRTRVSSAADEASKSGSSFIRNQASQSLPDAVRSVISNASPPSGSETTTETFDPFLE